MLGFESLISWEFWVFALFPVEVLRIKLTECVEQCICLANLLIRRLNDPVLTYKMGRGIKQIKLSLVLGSFTVRLAKRLNQGLVLSFALSLMSRDLLSYFLHTVD